MAQTLAQIRAKTRTSLHGRQLGIADDWLGGVKDLRKVVTAVTTAGTVLPNHGFITLATTAAARAVTLASPEPGVGVSMCILGVTTGGYVVTSASTAATFTSTAGIGDTKITIQKTGGNVSLMGVSTAIWMVLAGTSTGLFAVAS